MATTSSITGVESGAWTRRANLDASGVVLKTST